MAEKSANREFAPAHPHDAAAAVELLLEHLVADVRRARAADRAWLDAWLPRMSAHTYSGVSGG